MYKVLKMTSKFYAKKIDITDEDDIEDIESFTNEGTPVILFEDLQDLSILGINPENIEMVY